MFDWLHFLDTNRIEYVTHGPNVSAGHVAIHCPFCGHADKSQHLAVALDGRGWRCWRNPEEHKGKSPVKLIAALAHCSWEEAARIAGVRQALSFADFGQTIANMLDPPKAVKSSIHAVVLPRAFYAFDAPPPRMIAKYLHGRGYGNLPMLSTKYGLRYCTTGEFRSRIIFPVTVDSVCKTWTGRSVYPNDRLRYKALSADPDKARATGMPCAVGPISDYLLWWDLLLAGGDTLVLCEGPFDALRLNMLAFDRGVRATCCFGIRPSKTQIDLLHIARPHYRRALVLSDQGAEAQGLRTTRQLATLAFQHLQLPKGVGDPGQLNKTVLDQLLGLDAI